MNLKSPHILSIGQCQIDGPWMKRVLKKQLGAVVDESDTASEAVEKARQGHYQLILINRELALDQSSGLDLISDLSALSPQTPIMLVSDYEEAQQSAIQQGAARGFGKSNFEKPETLDRLKKIVHVAPAADPRSPS